MKQKVKLKGHLKSYLQTTLTLGILLAFVNVGIYFLNIKAGICVSGFLAIYLLMMATLLYYQFCHTVWADSEKAAAGFGAALCADG